MILSTESALRHIWRMVLSAPEFFWEDEDRFTSLVKYTWAQREDRNLAIFRKHGNYRAVCHVCFRSDESLHRNPAVIRGCFMCEHETHFAFENAMRLSWWISKLELHVPITRVVSYTILNDIIISFPRELLYERFLAATQFGHWLYTSKPQAVISFQRHAPEPMPAQVSDLQA